jgi:hypothetical protein
VNGGLRYACLVVDTASAAGWGHDIAEIRAAMRKACLRYRATVEEFAGFLLA